MINASPPPPPRMGQHFMRGGLEANDLFLLESRWCDKSPTLVAILRAAWPDFADPARLGSLRKGAGTILKVITLHILSLKAKQYVCIGYATLGAIALG